MSATLAAHRARTIGDVRYEVALTVPEDLDERVRGRVTVRFSLKETEHPLVLDFAAPRESVLELTVSGQRVPYEVANEHIVIPAGAMRGGENEVEIAFLAGDGPLNRSESFLYTLFVPDRARFAFPCFDQPDLKARFSLTLGLPSGWLAVSNGEVESIERPAAPRGASAVAETADRNAGGRRRQRAAAEGSGGVTGADRGVMQYRFGATAPLSTYLFSFAAGEFQVVVGQRDGRTMRMYHRETDDAKVERNREAIFDLHARALAWLEEYTGVAYPFEKFDFVLIPAFQYGGMEHPGAILYRASALLLEEVPTQNERLRRASLIAHETAHMWFGDLVTMEWFDDVWLKEVFANFMAAKIVNPSFPEIEHDLRFLLAHYPAAYGVDRTEGANPIRQRLENLNEAGSLYGAIIYQKAPIVMRQLEELVGQQMLRKGLREYLQRFSFANASWNDLIDILDSRSAEDLAAWSRVWVEQPGRPTLEVRRSSPSGAVLGPVHVLQSDLAGRGRVWNQIAHPLAGYRDTSHVQRVKLDGPAVALSAFSLLPNPDYLLPNGRGFAYGHARLDPESRGWLLEHAASISEPLTRGVVWVSLWEEMLEGRVAPEALLDLAEASLARERDELLAQRVLGYLESLFWRYTLPRERDQKAAGIEALLWTKMNESISPSLKAAIWNTYVSIALSDRGVGRLRELWSGASAIEGLPLGERDLTRLAQELAVREVDDWSGLLATQRQRIENPDRRARFEFIEPALSADPAVRDQFFKSLSASANREHEAWVVEAVGYLHHPLRAREAEAYIRPSLELLREIQVTGDIFFPKNWLDATLDGHNTRTAADIVRRFLDEDPDYPPRLRAKILQSADGLFRASEILAADRRDRASLTPRGDVASAPRSAYRRIIAPPDPPGDDRSPRAAASGPPP